MAAQELVHVSLCIILAAVERTLYHEAEQGRCYPSTALALNG